MTEITDLSNQLCDITTCSICLEILKEPKVLPCIHTFCLQCLDSFCESTNQEQERSCPLCRTVFSIPPGGTKNLPNNFFILQLLNVNKSAVTTEARETINKPSCELCSESEAKVTANSYCIDCDQHICDRCTGIHKKAKVSKSHQVVDSNNIPRLEERKKLAVNYCEQHPSEENRLYCYDCNMIMCNKCLSKHSQHKLSDVIEAAEIFREQLNEDINKLSDCISSQQWQLKQLEFDKENSLEKITSTQSEISQKCDQLISLIQSHKSRLTEELNTFKDKLVKQIATKKNDIEREFVITEGFKNYCVKIMDKGTACAISRMVHDLHARVAQLVKTQDESKRNTFSGVKITMRTSLPIADYVNKFFGEFSFQDTAADKTEDNQDTERINLTMFLSKPTALQVIPSPGKDHPVTGITVLGNDVFIVQNTSYVDVHKHEDFTFTRRLMITGSNQLRGLVSCSHYNCLYAVDPVQKIIYRYDLKTKVTTKWSVNGECHRLSVTKYYNVLATSCNPEIIQEYTTDGRSIREIRLNSDIDLPWHCVQQSTGYYVVCHVGTQHIACVLDQNGDILHYYGGPPGSHRGQMNNPFHIAIDKHDNVLIVDNGNNRVQLLSPTLTYLGDILIPRYQLINPYTLYFDELNHRLYIGEWSGGRLFVLGV